MKSKMVFVRSNFFSQDRAFDHTRAATRNIRHDRLRDRAVEDDRSRRRIRSNGGKKAGPQQREPAFNFKRDCAEAFSPITAMMVVAPPVPAMVVMTTPVPAHFRGHLLPNILLHRRCRARIDQRRRLGTLDRSRDHKHCADSRKTQNFKTQNFRSVHPNSPSHAISRQRRAAAP
jgi:hypothetical protein